MMRAADRPSQPETACNNYTGRGCITGMWQQRNVKDMLAVDRACARIMPFGIARTPDNPR